MRTTIHLVSARDFPFFSVGRARRTAGAVAEGSRGPGRRAAARGERAPASRRCSPTGRAAATSCSSIVGSDAMAWNGVGLFVDLVRAPPSGTWEHRRADIFALADQWLGRRRRDARGGRRAPRPALPERVRAGARARPRRLGGPPLQTVTERSGGSSSGDSATSPDASSSTCRARRYRIPRRRRRCASCRPGTRRCSSTRAGRASCPEQYRPRVFSTKTPHSVGTFLVDGAVAGTWRPERGRIVTKAFERLPRDVKRELDEEAERLARVPRSRF